MISHFGQGISLIPSRFRAKGILILIAVIFGAFLDLISLASFFPLLLLVVTPQQLPGKFRFIENADLSPGQSALLIVLLIVLIAILKSFYHYWLTHAKARYAYTVSQSLANGMMDVYFSLSYLNFTSQDHSREMNRISNFPLNFANNILIPSGTLLAECLVLFVLMAVAAVYSIQSFLLISAILLPSLLIYSFTRKQIRKTSATIKDAYPALLKSTLRGVEGWVDINAFGKQDFFLRKFTDSFSKVGRVFARDHALHASSSRTTELVASVCIAAIVLYALNSNRSLQESILLLSIYAGVSFRAIPSVSRILATFHQIQSNQYVLHSMKVANPTQKRELDKAHKGFHFNVTLERVAFAYEGRTTLNNIQLKINKGERVLIKGKSGEGKTTLLLLLANFIQPTSGNILWDGAPNSAGIRTAYIPQSPYLLDSTISENIAFGVEPKYVDNERIKKILADLDLTQWVNSLELGIKTVVGEKGVKISGGQRQRLVIGRALYQDVDVLLFDEITNQLDSDTEREILTFFETLSNKGITIVMVSHHLSDYRFFNSVYELRSGTLSSLISETQIR